MTLPSIDSLDFYELATNQPLAIIDVREVEEFVSGHVPTACNIPLSNFENEAPTLSNDRRYYIICRSGRRSLEATAWLQQRGFDAVNVVGGILEWPAELVQ